MKTSASLPDRDESAEHYKQKAFDFSPLLRSVNSTNARDLQNYFINNQYITDYINETNAKLTGNNLLFNSNTRARIPERCEVVDYVNARACR